MKVYVSFDMEGFSGIASDIIGYNPDAPMADLMCQTYVEIGL